LYIIAVVVVVVVVVVAVVVVVVLFMFVLSCLSAFLENSRVGCGLSAHSTG